MGGDILIVKFPRLYLNSEQKGVLLKDVGVWEGGVGSGGLGGEDVGSNGKSNSLLHWKLCWIHVNQSKKGEIYGSENQIDMVASR